jgi:hypothetical protein
MTSHGFRTPSECIILANANRLLVYGYDDVLKELEAVPGITVLGKYDGSIVSFDDSDANVPADIADGAGKDDGTVGNRGVRLQVSEGVNLLAAKGSCTRRSNNEDRLMAQRDGNAMLAMGPICAGDIAAMAKRELDKDCLERKMVRFISCAINGTIMSGGAVLSLFRELGIARTMEEVYIALKFMGFFCGDGSLTPHAIICRQVKKPDIEFMKMVAHTFGDGFSGGATDGGKTWTLSITKKSWLRYYHAVFQHKYTWSDLHGSVDSVMALVDACHPYPSPLSHIKSAKWLPQLLTLCSCLQLRWFLDGLQLADGKGGERKIYTSSTSFLHELAALVMCAGYSPRLSRRYDAGISKMVRPLGAEPDAPKQSLRTNHDGFAIYYASHTSGSGFASTHPVIRCATSVSAGPHDEITPVFNIALRGYKYIVVRSEIRDEQGVVVEAGRPVVIEASRLIYDTLKW